MTGCLWLIGGTQESRVLAEAIGAAGRPCVVTVATARAAALYSQAQGVVVVSGGLTAADLDAFQARFALCGILDASHPHAAAVSELAIQAARCWGIPYLRYERPAVTTDSDAGQQGFADMAALLRTANLTGQRVLFTVGYRALPLLKAWQTQATLFARILPSPTALETALAAGFSPERLVALWPPVPYALEKALWQQWQITAVVTKAAGRPGGEAIKRQLAQEMGVHLWVIGRPAVAYPAQTQDLDQALSFALRVTGQTSLGQPIRPLN
ncbi:MAG: cobalt-precorrin-6A reductase [Gloeomargaritaceae cyanobacterium C42_A2020_066]|nr:cobalt-precorrin-6A reductase [Gloeomargaritaceae cyanobacterium C42_A2020_066]